MEPMTLDFTEEVRNLVKHYQKFQTSVVCVFLVFQLICFVEQVYIFANVATSTSSSNFLPLSCDNAI
jgi:hypothetical protein